MDLVAREFDIARLAVGDGDGVAFYALQDAAIIALAVIAFGHRNLRLMPRPVGKILRAGQRAVDARRADFEVVGPFDQHIALLFKRVDLRRNGAAEFGALFDHQLPGRRVFRHDL